MSRASLEPAWRASAALLEAHADVLEARPREGEFPAALSRRGWVPWLLGLDDAQVDAFEVQGLEAPWPAAPEGLGALAAQIRAATALGPLAELPPRPGPARRRETPRKSAQVDAFAALVRPLAARASRVVDVGSGHGYLTRHLAGAIDRPVVGLERDPRRAEQATRLAGPGGPEFAVADVLRSGLPVGAGDCVLGLHACGELGDVMVEAAHAQGCTSLALVGCCLQKRRASTRAPLRAGGPSLARDVLGLSNVAPGDSGVERSRAENVLGRVRRLALRRLLVQAGAPPARFGDELAGLNRRAAHRALGELVQGAFARRGLAPPSEVQLREAELWAHDEFARLRRLALPRAWLGRVLEVFVALDRGGYLEAQGWEAAVGTVWAAAVSARNVGLIATR